MRFFSRFRKPRLVWFGHWSGRAETVTIEHDAIGAVAQAIECRGAEDAVAGERIAPFAEVEIAISYLELDLCYGKTTFLLSSTPDVLKR